MTLPFGTALEAESTGSTKRRFTSYDRSTVSGLDYAVNRHYDPLQGRFTQVDPIGMASVDLRNPQSLNLFAYCTNDPINQTDQSGLGFFSFLGKIFGFIAKVVKWLVFAVAVAVAVLSIAWLGFGAVWALKGLLILGQLWGTVIFSAVETGATVTAGEVIGVIAGVGAVNSFLAKKRERRSGKRKTVRQVTQAALSVEEVLKLVQENNQARDAGADDATVFCQAYKESRFRPNAINGSHRGLLQVYPPAAKTAGLGNGSNKPGRNPQYFSGIFDPAQNIRTGTRYLAIRIGWAGGDLTSGLEGFGTGAGYADDILGCASWVNIGLHAARQFGPETGRMFIDQGLRTIP